MNKLVQLSVIAAAVIASVGCVRIETGEVGLRIGFDKQINPTELQPGSFNQILIGDVLHFQVRSIGINVDNKTPQTLDNSTLKDFDFTAIYDINPTAVSDLWAKQNRAFHAVQGSEHFLMFHYMTNILNSAAYKAVRQYKAMEVADNRTKIEQDIKRFATEALKEEKLDTALVISQVQVRNALPADDIVASANAAVRAQNELKTKMVEVQTAEQEARRVQILNSNAQAIPYMNAMANMKIAEAVAAGKVHTVILPYDFKGMVNINAK